MSEPDASEAPYTDKWWADRTYDDLQHIIRGGFAGGDVYDGALRELERRARAMERQAEAAATAETKRQKSARLLTRFWFLAAIIAAAAIAAVAGVLSTR
jgi:hypothetical protein